MKKMLRTIIPVVLAVAVVASAVWYLTVYDKQFTRDTLVGAARSAESRGNHDLAQWIYALAYSQSGNSADIAIEMAEQYIDNGNFLLAERTLIDALGNDGNKELYTALCSTYVRQNKIFDAVRLLDSIPNPELKAELDSLRPKAPSPSEKGGKKNENITLSFSYENGTLYVNTQGQYPSVEKDLCQGSVALTGGLSNVWAVVIGPDNLVSTVVKEEYIITDVIEAVTFSDPAIEAAVRQQLSTGNNRTVYSNEIWEIKSFVMPAEAKTYADLRYFLNLEELVIENGISTELSHIASLPKINSLSIINCTIDENTLAIIGERTTLVELTLSGCSLSNASKLSTLSNLTYLDLSENTLRHLSFIKNFPELTYLDLSGNVIIDLSDISDLKKLKILDVTFNSLSTLAPVYSITGLEELYAGQNNISEVSNISHLQMLTTLDLHQNSIKNVTEIGKCTTLKYLNLSDNLLTDINALADLVNLVELRFAENQVKNLPKFKAECAIARLDASNNQISKIDNVSALKNLNYINLDYNENLSNLRPLQYCIVTLMQVDAFETNVTDISFLRDSGVTVNIGNT